MVRLITKPRVLIVGLSIAAALVILQGCPFNPNGGGKPNGDGKTQKSPVEVLKKIKYAFNGRYIEDYKDCLSEYFTFYFDPNDVGDDVGGYIIPETWDYYEETDAVKNMFDLAYSIRLTIDTAGLGEPGPDDNIYTADNVYIDLLLMVDSLNGYQASGFVDFEFVVEGEDASGNKIWRVKNWWDHTGVG